MTTLTAAQSAVVEAALAALNPAVESPKETITVKSPNAVTETEAVAPVAVETPAPVAAAPVAAAPVATPVVAVVVPKPVKAPWKCADCPTLIHPTGKRGRPAVRCDACKAKILQEKADAAAKAVADAKIAAAHAETLKAAAAAAPVVPAPVPVETPAVVSA